MTKPQSLHACHNVVRQVGTMDRMDFSTSTSPEHKRFSAYRDELAKRSCNLDLRVADESRFHADLEFRHAGTIGIMTNALTAIDTVRTPRLVRDGDDTLLVMLLLSGRAYQTQLGNDYALNAGDAIICLGGMTVAGYAPFPYTPTNGFTWDKGLALSSAQKLLKYPIARFASGHGPVREGGLGLLGSTLAKIGVNADRA